MPERLFELAEDHKAIEKRDWTQRGFYAKCKCGVWRCSVLIDRGELQPYPGDPLPFAATQDTPNG